MAELIADKITQNQLELDRKIHELKTDHDQVLVFLKKLSQE